MTQSEHWMYIKYRYDVCTHYDGIPPPPMEMWSEGIYDLTSPSASEWFGQRDLREMCAEFSSDLDAQSSVVTQMYRVVERPACTRR